MLKLIADNPEPEINQALADEHIHTYAPAFAAEVIRFILRQSPYDELKDICRQQFIDWWKLSMPSGSPKDNYESVYWYLLYLIESRREDELRGNRFANRRVKECACYLMNKGKFPDYARGIRP
ncbi:hypothetical protein A1OO_03715 [Enterovibrio norvegicus FF-33]|uniref:Uncharacterized protein n=1 Tax=Enterovibrio norvegicus FF-454 TaxID=1185651 RepID=A0A1E5C5D2_9GAMM|nr:hypothetical protein [Enterovibrio norvegicus]OEE60685.1 hypothetical protein A1OK_10345 [Enterovibrio norvegicus FF-454]OEE69901.1 hypothetical protein A1OO_03715 [Enterovibrio norvegicus FF-33]OEE90555.1 hypothetical protein A1OQ_00025 [Enterovibrio norvegicus FF-162]